MTSQPLEALQAANRVRSDQAQIKASLKAREMTMHEAINDPRAQSLTISRLLGYQRRWGPARTLALCRRVPVSELRRVRGLTDREKAVIARLCDVRAVER